MAKFEWDPIKSESNKNKHQISFIEAIQIWEGPHLDISDIARAKDGETRSATLGVIKGLVFLAIWTYRNKTIRLISVRRARQYEEEIYWQKII